MSDSPVVHAEGLGKIYRVYPRPLDRLLEVLGGRRRHRRFEALSDVSFDLPRGEGLGIIGENGAGKSTLLKIMAGVAAQTSGRLEVRGKVASILELGSGFHEDLTGRQNIRLNAALLGLSESEVEAKTPEIVAFSELGDFIDQPVKVYSTGMAMRLGFSIATQVEPDVLIIDEALSVGDGYFQKKCMDRLIRFTDEGGTLLFCSHAMYYVTSFCQRALWLRNGQVAALGEAAAVVREYESFLLARGDGDPAPAAEGEPGTEPTDDDRGSLATVTRAEVAGAASGSTHEVRYGDPLALDVEWQTSDTDLSFHLAVGIDRIDGVQVVSFSTRNDGLEAFSGRTHYRLRLDVPELPLRKGEFTIYVYLLDEHNLHPYDLEILPGAFRIVSEAYEVGLFRIDHHWWPEVAGPAVSSD